MLQKLPEGCFKWVKYVSEFTNNLIKKIMKTGYFVEVNFKYVEQFERLLGGLSFFLKK